MIVTKAPDMNIAVTGSSGFVGQVLCRELLANGHCLRLLVHSRQPSNPTNDRVRYVQGDLSDKRSLETLVPGVEVVIHLAAKLSAIDEHDPVLFHTNTAGTQYLLDAAKEAGVKQFIYLSSVNAYVARPTDESMDESRQLRTSGVPGYDLSKAIAQSMVLEANSPAMATIVLAPTAIIGPYDQQPSPLGQAIIKIYNGKIPALFPGGVDFVDVRDVVKAIVNTLSMGKAGKAYLLGGKWESLKYLTKKISLVKGKPISIPVLPAWLLLFLLPFIGMWAKITKHSPLYTKYAVDNLLYSNRQIDYSLAMADLQYHPRPLAETIQDTIAWFKTSGYLI